MKEKLAQLELMLAEEVMVSKKEFWMSITIASLLGILVGLVCAPLTHGVRIAMWNGNGCGNGNGQGQGKGKGKENAAKQDKEVPSRECCKGHRKDRRDRK